MPRSSVARAGAGLMRVEACTTAAAAGARAAALIAEQARAAVAERGRATLALSGGRTPTIMMRELAAARLPWPQIHIVQVDERIVGEDDDRRNMISIRAAFERSPIPTDHLHGMPVHCAVPEADATRYLRELCAIAGNPPCLDVVHLGLGDDGHTASLFAGDAGIDAASDVTVTGPHNGMRRMTLTLRALDRARSRIWLVTGRSKRDAVKRLRDGDPTLIASRVRRDPAVLVLDQDASAEPM